METRALEMCMAENTSGLSDTEKGSLATQKWIDEKKNNICDEVAAEREANIDNSLYSILTEVNDV